MAQKKHFIEITPEKMREHTEQGYAVLGAITDRRGFDPVAVVILSTLIFNTHTWLLHEYVYKTNKFQAIELRDE